tara:strand:- start:1102 stop:2952 length:1851 start_codon:yes stop_codon:yes gene_type:complete
MAENFYYKQTNIKEEDIYTNSRLRDNAFVKVIGKTQTLPISDTSFSATYNPNSTGRPAPVLKDVKISLEGEASSLRRAEVSYTCFDKTSFEKLEADLLIPGSEITIKYGYVGPSNSTQSGEYKFRVYDYSFKMTKTNNFECSLKAVAPGTGAEFDSLDINGKQNFPDEDFVTDYDGTNDITKVSNIFDYIDYQVQKQTDELNTSKWFNPEHGTCGRLDDGGHYGVLKAPDDYEPPTKLAVGKWCLDRIVYISLEGIIAMVNGYILSENDNKYEIQFKDEYSSVDYQYPAGKIWSPAPSRILIPYAKGTRENRYGVTMNCDAFAAKNSKAYDEFRVDAVGAKGILIGRDVLREIVNSLDTKVMNEDSSTEESQKSNSSLKLEDFFKKIFAAIRENTGGDWNFCLEREDSKIANNNKIPIWIVNKNSPFKGDPVTPLVLNPVSGKNGVRDMSMAGSVPKDIQAQAFGGAPNVTREQKSIQVITDERRKLEIEINAEIAEIRSKTHQVRRSLHLGSYDSDATAAAKGIIKRLVNAQTVEESVKKNKLMEPTPYPLKLSLQIDGIEGFRFGDTISSNYLPSRYTKNSGVRVVFTITKYTHTFKGNDWSTSIESVCRMVGE